MRTTAFGRKGERRVALAAAVLAAFLGAGGCSRQQPQTLTVAYSGDFRGAVDPCDCPGKEYGGLGRRATFLEAVRDTADNLLLVDAGDFFGSDISFGTAKAEVMLNSMALMGYHGLVVGEKDFGFGVEYIVSRAADIGLPVLAANLYDATTGDLLFSPSRVVEFADGLKVGLIGVVGDQLQLPPQVPEGTLEIADPAEAVRREAAVFEGGVDVVVVLAHVPEMQARKLAQAVPDVDLIVYGHDGRQQRKVRRFGSAFVLGGPKEGSHAGVAFVIVGEDGGVGTLTTSQTPLSDRYEDHAAVVELFREHGL
jgi:2',3'-cyclic-nucleotide 2'-phosphodiesterase (5'-nucleotidase family)